ncbi:alanine racemase [Sphingomonas sp. ID0503]|uniref:alanine racemase n=1 Tax=Sphingomonas sp. ID0503 TaxID=3399691 RepID=UPI003AFA2B0D
MPSPLRLTFDSDALVSNWRWLAGSSGRAACGAAVKADGYGLGARGVVERLAAAGCRDFFVATWAEAEALGEWPAELSLSVLHGVRAEDMAFALSHPARPVLNSVEQVNRWREAGGGACDVMVDSGMNRLGLSLTQAAGGALDGLAIETLMSHLASADEPERQMSRRQLEAFLPVATTVKARRRSFANSAGICLGQDYAFDLTRPGLALYGGVPHKAAAGHILQVVRPEAQVVQVREAKKGQTVGYGGTHKCKEDTRIAILNIGYADGHLRGFSGTGRVLAGRAEMPVVGRVSMDLMAVDIGREAVSEGDWLPIDFDLPRAAAQSGLSQYELLTSLGHRYQRRWT